MQSEDQKYRLKKAYFSYYEKSFALVLKGKLDGNSYNGIDIQMDVHCSNSKVLPIEARTAMQFLLPYTFNYDKQNMLHDYPGSPKKTYLTQFDKDDSTVIQLFEDKQVSKDKLIEHLEMIVKKGDPIFTLDFFREDVNLVEIHTKASLLLASLRKDKQQNQPSIIYQGIVSKRKWWLCAFMFMIGCWMLLLYPHRVYQYFTPRIFNVTKFEISWNKVLPLVPNDMLQAYDLGTIVNQYLQLHQNNQNSAQLAYYIDQIKKVTGRSVVSHEQIIKIRDEIVKIIEHKSIIQKCLGLLSFINIIWLFSIFGLVISVGPCVFFIFRPVFKMFANLFILIGTFITKIVKFLFLRIILPLFNFCHNQGILEMLIFLFIFQFISESVRLNNDNSFASITVFSGLIMSSMAFVYSTSLHTKKIRAKKNPKTFQILIITWKILCLIPITIMIQSQLLGYLTFCLVFILLGFRMYVFGCGICLGWENEDGLIQSLESSVKILFIFCALKYYRVAKHYLDPFSSAVQVLGTNILFLALLIVCNKQFRFRENSRYGNIKNPYIFLNTIMILLLVAAIYYGNVYFLQALANTATVYAVIYALFKYTELVFLVRGEAIFWFYMFSCSAILYKLAIWIHSNPQLIVALYSSDL